ncbi:hypothetical protein N7462_005589 [Penicillium macrosclerotiorum]|uniref:uncharacterized protein n=1 Tax=Penicillium macrosclerotiorum TaxID=303699 RepID=UPI0025487258|nr:uncharacterized protein N7462_005589 [Penicillium macrosclerotiorum]KAJ5682424.1 hypothetical protein N7462_005589 [Penicillium macrosclerotiorum]
MLTGGIPLMALIMGIIWVPLKRQTAIFSSSFAVIIAFGHIVPILHIPHFVLSLQFSERVPVYTALSDGAKTTVLTIAI